MRSRCKEEDQFHNERMSMLGPTLLDTLRHRGKVNKICLFLHLVQCAQIVFLPELRRDNIVDKPNNAKKE